jgi:hypothetical protein
MNHRHRHTHPIKQIRFRQLTCDDCGRTLNTKRLAVITASGNHFCVSCLLVRYNRASNQH